MEVWDLYDKDRNKTTKQMIRGDVVPKGYYHLVVESLIINDKNHILIQKRHPQKKGHPNWWEFSCAGSATAKDTSLQAIKREVSEEIGIALDDKDFELISTVTQVPCHWDLYLIKKNINLEDIKVQPEEVVDVNWVSYKELLAMVEAKTFIDYSKCGRKQFKILEEIFNEDSN